MARQVHRKKTRCAQGCGEGGGWKKRLEKDYGHVYKDTHAKKMKGVVSPPWDRIEGLQREGSKVMDRTT